MNEEFKVVDYRLFKKNDGSKLGYIMLYSNLGYLVPVYVRKESIELFEDIVDSGHFFDYDFLKNIIKIYNKDKNTFSYYWGE